MTRERIRNEVAEGNWDLFNQLLDSTPRGNFGNIGKHKSSGSQYIWAVSHLVRLIYLRPELGLVAFANSPIIIVQCVTTSCALKRQF